ncbi:hypothetical protein L1987_76351 [Smallanthus sonchifolius]|uniref:Uncharacterized protein n=1 Tax=Smallanthus sonchifolius TaxID=185202 RepID=A0ACB9A8K8_9ASTR|nr:hypothetical protein L1987_76351 [Smallanthus sonchifolius]
MRSVLLYVNCEFFCERQYQAPDELMALFLSWYAILSLPLQVLKVGIGGFMSNRPSIPKGSTTPIDYVYIQYAGGVAKLPVKQASKFLYCYNLILLMLTLDFKVSFMGYQILLAALWSKKNHADFAQEVDSLAHAIADEMHKVYTKELRPTPVPLTVDGEVIDEEDMYFLDANNESDDDVEGKDVDEKDGADLEKSPLIVGTEVLSLPALQYVVVVGTSHSSNPPSFINNSPKSMAISDMVVGNLTILYLTAIAVIKVYGYLIGRYYGGVAVLVMSTAVVGGLLVGALTWDVSRKVVTCGTVTRGDDEVAHEMCRGGICWHGVAVKSPASQVRFRLPQRHAMNRQ